MLLRWLNAASAILVALFPTGIKVPIEMSCAMVFKSWCRRGNKRQAKGQSAFALAFWSGSGCGMESGEQEASGRADWHKAQSG